MWDESTFLGEESLVLPGEHFTNLELENTVQRITYLSTEQVTISEH